MSARLSRVETKLLGLVGSCIHDHELIAEGDRIMVAMSGGKDSYGLLHVLRLLQARSPVKFSLVAVNLDQGHPGFPAERLEGWLKDQGFEYKMLQRDTYSIVLEKVPAGQTYCSLCSRLRRGILYDAAVELGATKIALGHHRDDTLETLMMNLMFTGQLKAMPAKLFSDDGRNTVIRPLLYCAEADMSALSEEQGFPILPCNLCGSQDGMQRQRVKHLLNCLEKEYPRLRHSMLAALENVRPTHLLDRSLERKGKLAASDDPLAALEKRVDPPHDA